MNQCIGKNSFFTHVDNPHINNRYIWVKHSIHRRKKQFFFENEFKILKSFGGENNSFGAFSFHFRIFYVKIF